MDRAAKTVAPRTARWQQKAGLSRGCEFDHLQILHARRMAGKRAATAASFVRSGRRLWALCRLAAMRRQGCSETSPGRFCQTTPGSPKLPVGSGAALTPLRVRSIKAHFPKVAVQRVMTVPSDAAFRTSDSGAQKAGFANLWQFPKSRLARRYQRANGSL